MLDVIANAENWLATQRAEYLSKEVTLKRGASERSGIAAMQGSTRAENTDLEGLSIRTKVVDFVIDVNQYYIMSGSLLEPTAGDQIIRADGLIFEVAEIGAEPCWRWHDRASSAYRIHTKHVGSE